MSTAGLGNRICHTEITLAYVQPSIDLEMEWRLTQLDETEYIRVLVKQVLTSSSDFPQHEFEAVLLYAAA